ncbi:MAG: hypothetical protein P8Y29_07280, partial [Gemmatimonadota bacterium]
SGKEPVQITAPRAGHHVIAVAMISGHRSTHRNAPELWAIGEKRCDHSIVLQEFRSVPVGGAVPANHRDGDYMMTRPWSGDLDGFFAARLVREAA